MSLVLEALRRVEKPEARPGSVGVAVDSYRPKGRRRAGILPLVLGLGTGAALLLVSQTPSQTSIVSADEPQRAGGSSIAPPRSVSAAMPEPQPSETTTRPSDVRRSAVSPSTSPDSNSAASSSRDLRPGAGEEQLANRARPMPQPLVLQAISERDSLPIAVISDQLVREGDVFEGARILSIGPESVDVLLEDGRKTTLRFPPPPPTGLSPSPPSR